MGLLGCVSIGSGSLFSIHVLCRVMDIAYLAMTSISSNVCLMLTLGILHVDSMLSIEGVRVFALALAVMTISGYALHPLLIILSIDGS